MTEKLSEQKRSQSARKSKAKGSDFEREVAAKFTEVLYPDGSGVVKRVPLSGGWSRFMSCDIIAFKKVGDRLLNDERWKVHVECKIREYLDMLGIWSGNVDTPVKWFLDAKVKSSLPTILIFRQSRVKTALFMMAMSGFHRVIPHLPDEITTLRVLTLDGYVALLIGKFEDFLKLYSKTWRKT